jgi:lipoate-protein ligase A
MYYCVDSDLPNLKYLIGTNMNKWRMIMSGAADGVTNMALDEAIFTVQSQSADFKPTIRVYTWDKPCVTIGYFQKYADFSGKGTPVVRRMTGGLSVQHGSDISYCLITNDQYWKYVYDQENTYREIHAFIKDALAGMRIASEFVSPAEETPVNLKANNVCVKTFYQHDLHNDKRKIVGSCQRRRGKNLLVQGSIHLQNKIIYSILCNNIISAFNKSHAGIEPGLLTNEELKYAKTFACEKYSTPAWNEKY